LQLHHIETLTELRTHLTAGERDWHVHLVKPDLNGGKTTQQELDIALESRAVTALTISGLDQQSFEHLVTRFGKKLTAIHFWKCPRIDDLSPLEEMRELTHLAFFLNKRATSLWDLSKTRKLRALHFEDFSKLQDLRDLERGSSLSDLAFGNAVWAKFAAPSLEPLSALSSLRSLHFNLKAVGDGRIEPLGKLTGLKELEFSSSLFTTEQLAWLRARLPPSVNSSVLQAYRPLGQPITGGGKEVDVLVSGKGKPFLSTRADSERLQRYVETFNKSVLKYASNTTLAPGGAT
jgi:hypothetical protein